MSRIETLCKFRHLLYLFEKEYVIHSIHVCKKIGLQYKSPRQLCEELLVLARSRGGHENSFFIYSVDIVSFNGYVWNRPKNELSAPIEMVVFKPGMLMKLYFYIGHDYGT